MKTKTRKGRAWGLLSPKVLRKAREREGMSRKALAEKLGVSPGAIQNWESDASTPTPEMQAKIADALKISSEQGATEPTTVDTATANSLLNAVTDKVIQQSLTASSDTVADATAHVVSAMIHKGLVATMDEVKAALATVSAAFRA